MYSRVIGLMTTAVLVVAVVASVALLSSGGAKDTSNNAGSEEQAVSQSDYLHPVLRPDDREFDPRDLNGIWTRGNPDGGLGGASSCIEAWTHTGPCGDRGFSQDWPTFTPDGQAVFDSYKPSYGRRLGSEDAAAHPEEHIGRRRAVAGGAANDPQTACNPLGVTRAVLYPQENEFFILEDRILQHFSQTNAWRTIWMDGRELPPYDEIQQPLWYGYSVGRWEGDTLVVETVGQDDRIWLDHFGYPISDEAHLEERYRRTKFSVLELNMKLTDPKYYAKPWVGQPKKFLWRPQDYFKIVIGTECTMTIAPLRTKSTSSNP